MESRTSSATRQIIASLRDRVSRIPITEQEYRVLLPDGRIYTGDHSGYLLETNGSMCKIYGSVEEIGLVYKQFDEDIIKDEQIKVRQCTKTVEITSGVMIYKYKHSSMIECSISCLEEFSSSPFIYPPKPEDRICLGVKSKPSIQNNSRVAILYRYNDSEEALASSIFRAWEHYTQEKVIMGLRGVKEEDRENQESFAYSEGDIRLDQTVPYEITSPELTNIFESYTSKFKQAFNEDRWIIENRAAVAIQKLIREHVKDNMLPKIFYDLASDRLIKYYSERWGVKKGYFFSRTSEPYHTIRFFLKVTGLAPEELKIPEDTTDKFLKELEFVFQKDLQISQKRKTRTECNSMEARMQIVEKFVKSISSRTRSASAANKSAASTKKEWMKLHSDLMCRMIERFQEISPRVHFHIDHIVPLIALPEEIAEDLMSYAWHPCNLCIKSENSNLSKSSLFNGKRITKKNKTKEDEQKAIEHLENLHGRFTYFKGNTKITYSE